MKKSRFTDCQIMDALKRVGAGLSVPEVCRELVLQLVVGRLTDAVLPARLTDLRAHLDLLEDADYLRFAESGFLHVETPLDGFSTPGWLSFSRGLQSQYHWRDLDEGRLYATNWMWMYNHERPNMALGGITQNSGWP